MTHTLHREGTEESLKDDFVLVITGAKGFNKKGCAPRLRKMMNVVSGFNPINMGCMEVGNIGRGVPISEIIKNAKDSDLVQAVFNDEETVVEVLKALKEVDQGISVVVSGNNTEVVRIIKKAGLGENPHTTNLSLGFMGRVEKVASDEERLITTMCGHHMISKTIVSHHLERIKEGLVSPLDAAIDMSRQCTCGAFNTVRAARILRDLAGIS